jgi:UTP--glucose-1-phosphate uridylyltransferase
VITDAIVPVAGLGTRLLPATRSAPKEMLPIVDKPIVQYVVEELQRAGLSRVLFVTGRRKRAIEDHFDGDPELGSQPEPGDGMRLLYTRQSRAAGLGDAIRHGEGFAHGGGVVVALGDAIIDPPAADGPGIVARLIDVHERHRASATLAVATVPDDDVGRYGIAVGSGPMGEDGAIEVSQLLETPDPGTVDSRLAVAARYVLGPEVFAALHDVVPDARGELQLTDAIQAVIEAGGRVLAVPLTGGERRHDIGTVEGYCSAFLEHALRHPVLGERLRARAAALLDDG